jgi:hypothetical protein
VATSWTCLVSSTSGLGISGLPSSVRAPPLADGTASFEPGRGGRGLLR